VQPDAAEKLSFVRNRASGGGQPTGIWSADKTSIAYIIGFGRVAAEGTQLSVLGDKVKAKDPVRLTFNPFPIVVCSLIEFKHAVAEQ
jgi:hypothetical protein